MPASPIVPFVVKATTFSFSSDPDITVHQAGTFDPGTPFDGTYLWCDSDSVVRNNPPDIHQYIPWDSGTFTVTVGFPDFHPPFTPWQAYLVSSGPLAYGVFGITRPQSSLISLTGGTGTALDRALPVTKADTGGDSSMLIGWTDIKDLTTGLVAVYNMPWWTIFQGVQLWLLATGASPPLRQRQRQDGYL